MEKIDRYFEILYIQEDLTNINEIDLTAFIQKLTPESKTKTLVKKIKGVVNEKDPLQSMKKVGAVVKHLPTLKISSIDKFLGLKIKEFGPLKKTSKTILANSVPGLSKQSLEIASSFLAFSSMITKKGEKFTTKQNLKKNATVFVSKVRKFGEDYSADPEKNKGRGLQKEDIPDLAVAWVIIAMSTALAVGLISGMYIISGAIAGMILTPSIGVIAIISIIVVVIYLVFVRIKIGEI